MRISERSLLTRINRKFRHEEEAVRKCRVNSRWYFELGDYFCVDLNSNFIIAKDIGLECLGRELGVLGQADELLLWQTEDCPAT
jgi:hypothetical protein